MAQFLFIGGNFIIKNIFKSIIMMKSKVLMLGIASTLFLASCSKKETTETNGTTDSATAVQPAATDSITKATPTAAGDTSENALDWAGTYEATVPCADCPGIKTSLTLNNDKTFSITEEYLDKNSKNQDKGSFVWDTTGSMITLKGKSVNYKYKVGENILFQLDMNGKEIDGPVFKKK
jgi:uncharacterized lipoprotein NlpE involved in copper resistance